MAARGCLFPEDIRKVYKKLLFTALQKAQFCKQ